MGQDESSAAAFQAKSRRRGHGGRQADRDVVEPEIEPAGAFPRDGAEPVR